MWGIYCDGAVLGGTSAGAAIMSDVMLAGGGSLDTLSRGFTDTYDGLVQQEGGPAYLERGLDFFRCGIGRRGAEVGLRGDVLDPETGLLEQHPCPLDALL